MKRRSFLAALVGAPVAIGGMPSATARKAACEALARAARETQEMRVQRVLNNAWDDPVMREGLAVWANRRESV